MRIGMLLALVGMLSLSNFELQAQLNMVEPFFGPTIDFLKIDDKQALMIGATAGVVLAERWQISVYGGGTPTNLTEQIDETTTIYLLWKEIGASTSYLHPLGRSTKLHFGSDLSFGQMSATDLSKFRDRIMLINPNVGLQFRALGFLVLEGHVGYRFASFVNDKNAITANSPQGSLFAGMEMRVTRPWKRTRPETY